MKNHRYLFLGILFSIISALSFNFRWAWSFVWFSLAPLFFFVYKSESKKRIFVYSYIWGFFHFLFALHWVSNVSRLGLCVLAFYLAFYWAFFFLAFKCLIRRRFIDLLSIPSLWVVFEYLREHVWVGFGWGIWGYSQFQNSYLIQIADIGGVKLVSFLIVLVNFFVFSVFVKSYRRYLIRYIVVLILSLYMAVSYSYFQLKTTIRFVDSLKISAIQPNIPQDIKWDQMHALDIIEVLRDLARKTPADSLVIFPETSWPEILDTEDLHIIGVFVKAINRDVLIGAVLSQNDKFYNTALIFDRGGDFHDIYRKVILVPFGEYVPFRKALGFVSILNELGDMSPGQEYKVFDYKGRKFSVLICFEDVFPQLCSGFVRKGARFLVNITNDAWFGGHPEALQHLGIAVFRAIENRRALVRVANTGISCVISPKGKVTELLQKGNKDVMIEGTLDAEVPLLEEITLYHRGNVIFIVCAILIVGAGTILKRREG